MFFLVLLYVFNIDLFEFSHLCKVDDATSFPGSAGRRETLETSFADGENSLIVERNPGIVQREEISSDVSAYWT